MKSAPSGKFVLRLPPHVHREAREKARVLGISLNELCAQLIERGLVMKDGEELFPVEKFIGHAKHFFHDELLGILLFGSHARGQAHDASDIDVLIVLADQVAIERELYASWDKKYRDDIFPENLSVHFAKMPQEASEAGSLWLECALDAKVLYDPHRTIQHRLQLIRDFITSGKVIRQQTHGQGYWVRV